jgi:capsular polysaccharide biosynthesis protein
LRPVTHPGVFRIEDYPGALDCVDAGEVVAVEAQVHREPMPDDPFGLTQLRERPAEIAFPQARVVSVREGRVSSRLGAFTQGQDLVLWLSHGAQADSARATYAQASGERLRRPIHVEAPAICLAHTSPGNYYHFMVDVSTQLTVCEYLGVTPEVVVLWGGWMTAWQQAILDAYGVSPERVLVPPADSRLEFDELWMASPLNVRLSRGDNVWLYRRDLLDRHIRRIAGPDISGNGAPRRLFLSRRGYWRTIKNQDRVADMLVDAGFEEVEPGDLSLAEQVTLFSSAEAVFAAHGAAMTNIVFAPRGCHVGEVRPPGYSPCYAHLAAIRGLRHTPMSSAAEYGDDFDAPLDLVEAWLASLGQADSR